jgi:hypothetical protein
MFTCVIHPFLSLGMRLAQPHSLSPLRRASWLCLSCLLAFAAHLLLSSASQPWRPPMARVSSTSTSSRTTMSTAPSPAPSSLPIPIPIPPRSTSRMMPSPRRPNCTTSLLPPLPAIHSSRVPPPPHSFIWKFLSRSFVFQSLLQLLLHIRSFVRPFVRIAVAQCPRV